MKDLIILSLNTHQGLGPLESCLVDNNQLKLANKTKGYSYLIAEWLKENRDKYDIVGLQEVYAGILGTWHFGFTQGDVYKAMSGFDNFYNYRLGFFGMQSDNIILTNHQLSEERKIFPDINFKLPEKLFLLYSAGFQLLPIMIDGKKIWVGHTHLHPSNPKKRIKQAEFICELLSKIKDEPIILLGDFNSLPNNHKKNGFNHGDKDHKSYLNDRTIEIFCNSGLFSCFPFQEEHFTYPTGKPNRVLDYIFWSKHFSCIEYKVLENFVWSDHYPVQAKLSIID